jgi:phage terminase large subunit-like protein
MIWRDDENDCFYMKCQHFVNEAMAHSKKLSGGIDYQMFSRQGYVTITHGNVNDMDAVQHFILEQCAKYDVRMVAYDRWNAHTIVPQLVEQEIEVEPFGQGFRSMAYPTKALEVELCKGKIIHGGHPVLRWQMGCVHLQRDEADNIKVTKKKNSQSQKVDGIVACIMALGTYYNNLDADPMSLDIVHL